MVDLKGKYAIVAKIERTEWLNGIEGNHWITGRGHLGKVWPKYPG